jgi:hypothetical protein
MEVIQLDKSKCIVTTIALLLAAYGVSAQTTPPAAPPAPPASSPEWSVGPIDFSGLIDGYYSLNFNHPASRVNQLRNFDVEANQFSLNMAKLTLEHTPDPIGFRFDLGFGKAFDIVHGSEAEPGVFRNIEQAFVSVKPKQAKGFQVDFGKFVTSAGAEVIETNGNWNYSRSLLFAWAIPYYHFGLRTSMPLGKYFSAGVQLVNGWNTVEDNNSGKTLGLTGTFAISKFSLTHSFYVGPEKIDTNKGLRHLYDTVLQVNPGKRTNVYLNFDYGTEKNIGPGEQRWVGIAGASRFQISRLFAVTPRLEWFNDADGFATGTVQKIKEFTFTGEMKMREGILSRLEYRRDWSNVPFFDRGAIPASFNHQDTLLLGVVAYFGPKR